MPRDEAQPATNKNRYAHAPRNRDYTIDQMWQSYTPEEHDRWNRLLTRAQAGLQNRACSEFLAALQQLPLSEGGIPNMEKLSDKLEAISGWRVVPVAELVPDAVFFEHLANKRFPAGAFIRPEAEFDYLEEPDIFHDIFGHVPLLANPVYSDFMQAYGLGGQRALDLGKLQHLARLYWYTIEFGLLKTPGGLRIFGAGIMSSPAETRFALESTSPNRVAFDLKRVMRTKYVIDDFQQTYFVIDSFEKLLEDCYQDFGALYEELPTVTDLEAHEIAPSDEVYSWGTRAHFGKAT